MKSSKRRASGDSASSEKLGGSGTLVEGPVKSQSVILNSFKRLPSQGTTAFPPAETRPQMGNYSVKMVNQNHPTAFFAFSPTQQSMFKRNPANESVGAKQPDMFSSELFKPQESLSEFPRPFSFHVDPRMMRVSDQGDVQRLQYMIQMQQRLQDGTLSSNGGTSSSRNPKGSRMSGKNGPRK